MERRPRQGRRIAGPKIERDEDGVEWRRANGCFIQIAEGFTVDGKKKLASFRVGLHLVDGSVPLARLALNEDQALSLAKSLIAYSASVDHLVKHHPDGDREKCTYQPERPSEEWVGQLVDESLGPLERSIGRARSYVGEVASALAALQTLALEEGLLIPDGAHVKMEEGTEKEVERRIEQLMTLISSEARRVLLMALYLTGDETLAHLFGVTRHKPSDDETAH
jgi:hypothetical protein